MFSKLFTMLSLFTLIIKLSTFHELMVIHCFIIMIGPMIIYSHHWLIIYHLNVIKINFFLLVQKHPSF